MAIAMTLQQYLVDREIPYDVVSHDATMTSAESAHASHVPGDRVAKAVIVTDDERYMMAVVPATHHIQMDALSRMFERPMHLATEKEASALFDDCDLGAFPALGFAYGLDVVVDDNLVAQPDLYFEGGDHRSLVHLKAEAFRKLMGQSHHGSFSARD